MIFKKPYLLDDSSNSLDDSSKPLLDEPSKPLEELALGTVSYETDSPTGQEEEMETDSKGQSQPRRTPRTPKKNEPPSRPTLNPSSHSGPTYVSRDKCITDENGCLHSRYIQVLVIYFKRNILRQKC